MKVKYGFFKLVVAIVTENTYKQFLLHINDTTDF